jgi:hypothetical protein
LPREPTCGKVEIVSGPDTQQSPPPPPPPRSGSPFGRFLTSPVLLVGVIALVVGFTTFRYVDGDGGAGDAGPASQGIAGSWESVPGAGAGGAPVVRLELTRSGGTLAIGSCKGELTPRGDDVFAYRDTSGGRGCPRRMRVTVSQVDRDTLRVAVKRRGIPSVSHTLERR